MEHNIIMMIGAVLLYIGLAYWTTMIVNRENGSGNITIGEVLSGLLFPIRWCLTLLIIVLALIISLVLGFAVFCLFVKHVFLNDDEGDGDNCDTAEEVQEEDTKDEEGLGITEVI